MKLGKANILEFWNNVRVVDPNDPNTCWEYTGPVDMNGYGIYRSVLAHRVAVLAYMPPGGLHVPGKVTKKCNNRRCVRREHIDNVYPPKNANIDNIKVQVFKARGEGRYKIEEIAKKVNLPLMKVRMILREAALYDIMKDVERYHNNKIPVPIIPDTRKVAHAPT